MASAEERLFERFRYRQGQTVRSRDFEDRLDREDELRWWHNRALHRSFGIASGLTASLVSGSHNEQEVEVSPGLAYDCYGHELILRQAMRIRLPREGANEWTLLLRHPEDRSEECSPACGCASNRSEPILRWQATATLGVRDGVPVARIEIDEQEPSKVHLGLIVPRTRAEARPRTMSGATVQGKTAWREAVLTPEQDSVLATAMHSLDSTPADFLLSAERRGSLGFSRELFSNAVRLNFPGMLNQEWGEEFSALLAPTTPETAIRGARLTSAFHTRARTGPLGVEVTVDTSSGGFTNTPCYFAWLAGVPKRFDDRAVLTHSRITEVRSDRFSLHAWISLDRNQSLSFALRYLYVYWIGMET